MSTNSATIPGPNPARRDVRWLLLTVVPVLAVLVLGAGRANATDDEKLTVKVRSGTLVVDATSRDEEIALRLKAGDPATLEVDRGDDGSADFSFARSRFTEIDVDAGAGADVIRIDEANGVFTDTEETTLRGNVGNDSILGGSGSEKLRGGHGDDFVDGNRGDDVASLSTGFDFFLWDPGDGSDRVDGAGDEDVMLFRGSNQAEVFRVLPDGDDANLSRNVGDILMETDSVETFLIDTLSGADNIQIEDMAGTDLAKVEVDLSAELQSPVPDGFADRVLVKGSAADESVEVVGNNGIAAVTGLSTLVRVSHAEVPADNLVVAALDGRDTINASTLTASAIRLTLDGGEGGDTLLGGAGADLLLGGAQEDFIDGNRGDDEAQMSFSNDTFRWDPGDGSDLIDGQQGLDTMLFNGAGIPENFDVSRSGQRVRFFRDVANITMELISTERIDLNALGGADNVVVNDLSGTAMDEIAIDLAAALGGIVGDGQPDAITVNATEGDDLIAVSGAGGGVSVAGLAAAAAITQAEPALDSLVLNTLAGIDSVDSSGLTANTIQFTVN
jgi:RTX calcium-binding nonapeptide repeat (4 copies)